MSTRAALIVGLVAAALPAVAVARTGAGRPGGSSAAVSAPRAQLADLTCHQALQPAHRTISIEAVMRPVTGTRGLQIRFVLSARTVGAAATAVSGSGLGVWLSPSDPTLGQQAADVWKLNKTVSNLAAARYGFAVGFRWLGDHDRVLATTVRTSATCSITETRPDLLVRSIAVRRIAKRPHKDRYVAVIVNRGLTAAGPFDVLFTPGIAGLASQTRTIGFLKAGESRSETFDGPLCSAASPPTVVADSTDAVDDYNRSNNALTATCPAAAPVPATAG